MIKVRFLKMKNVLICDENNATMQKRHHEPKIKMNDKYIKKYFECK